MVILSMPTSSGPEWMAFLLPVLAFLLLFQGVKKLIQWQKKKKEKAQRRPVKDFYGSSMN